MTPCRQAWGQILQGQTGSRVKLPQPHRACPSPWGRSPAAFPFFPAWKAKCKDEVHYQQWSSMTWLGVQTGSVRYWFLWRPEEKPAFLEMAEATESHPACMRTMYWNCPRKSRKARHVIIGEGMK